MKKSAEFILPLDMNGLSGRMLRAPSVNARKREILLIYGHHAMLERWWSLVENLREYGNVTVPDLPGFGGMDSFSKIGIRPSIDAYADYLAAFVKLRYKRKKVTVYAISFGFVVVTRMLQLHPELSKKINLMVSTVGFMHKDDLRMPTGQKFISRILARLFATKPVATLIRYIALNKPVVKAFTKIMPHSKHRYIKVTPLEFEQAIDFDVLLWQVNDVRTHWLTTSQFFSLDITKSPVALPIIHIATEGDHYLDNILVEQHMRKVFKDYKRFVAKTKTHVPYPTADKAATAELLPLGLRKLLSSTKSV
ncbi:MAG TPA: alpha/beta fold hydrolase [Candidatus Babeliales bacterium]|nr:alpha/beta fold hydrolase [Candidatus Babeliales bacterium]